MTLIVHYKDNQLGKLNLSPSSQTNLSFLHLVFYTKQEVRVTFSSTKSESKSEVRYLLKWQFQFPVSQNWQFPIPQPSPLEALATALPSMGLNWLLKKRYFPSSDHHLLLNFLFFSRIGITIVCQVPLAKTIWPWQSLNLIYTPLLKRLSQMSEHCTWKWNC